MDKLTREKIFRTIYKVANMLGRCDPYITNFYLQLGFRINLIIFFMQFLKEYNDCASLASEGRLFHNLAPLYKTFFQEFSFWLSQGEISRIISDVIRLNKIPSRYCIFQNWSSTVTRDFVHKYILVRLVSKFSQARDRRTSPDLISYLAPAIILAARF